MEEVPAAPEADREALAVLDEEVAALPERFRAAFVLCELTGLSRKRRRRGWAARSAPSPRGSGRARQRLRERLKQRGLGMPAVILPLLPAALPGLTLKAALSLGGSAGRRRAGAAALMTEVLNAMFLTKLKMAFAVGVAAVGSASAGCRPTSTSRAAAAEKARTNKRAAAEVKRLETAEKREKAAAAEVKRLDAAEKARADAKNPVIVDVTFVDVSPMRQAKVDAAEERGRESRC